MYGGNGKDPTASIAALRSPEVDPAHIRIRKVSPTADRPSTSANSSPAAVARISPTRILRPGRISASHSLSSSCKGSSRSTSTRPPVLRTRERRLGNTLVSFTTRTSPACKKSVISLTFLCSTTPFTYTNKRAASRGSMGTCAIKCSGKL
jgi:hypothetical protein